MASWAPACCMCWAMAQAMLRLLATPNTTTVRPSMLIAIRESSSACAVELIGSIFEDISLAARMSCGGGCAAPANVGRRALTAQIFSFLCGDLGNILPKTTGAPLRRRRYGDDTRFADQSDYPLCPTRPDSVRGGPIYGCQQSRRRPRVGGHQPSGNFFRTRHHEQ